MTQLSIILKFILDIVTLGLTYKARKRKEEKENEKKKQSEQQETQEKLLSEQRS